MRRSWVLSVLVIALLVTACAKAPPARVKPAAALQQPTITTIRIALWASTEPLYAPVFAAFQDKHPEYRVETAPINNPTDLEALLKNGSVDLTPNTFGWEYMLRTGKRLIDLSPYVAQSRFDTAAFGPLLENDKVGGRLYGLPLHGYPYIFAYNKRLVAAAGVTIPTGSWTWEELRDTAARLTSGSGEAKIWGFDWAHVNPDSLLYMMALQRAPAGGVPDDRTLRDVLSFFQPMVKNSMPPTPTDFSVQPPPVYCDAGKAALCLMPYTALSRPEFTDFGMAPFPAAPPDKPMVLANLVSYAITAAAENPDAAWALLNFMAGPEGSLLFTKSGQVPVYSNDANRQAWLESPAPKPQGSEILLRAPWYVPPTFSEHYSPYGAVMAAARDVLSGIRDVDEAMADYEAILKKSK